MRPRRPSPTSRTTPEQRPEHLLVDTGPTWELRGRRTTDGNLALEKWQRIDSVIVSAEALSRLHILIEHRVTSTPKK